MTALSPGLQRAKSIRFVLWAILLANWAVAAAKLAFGLIYGSAALTADGLHSFVDGGSNVVGLVAMWISAQPPDANHPYGHEKFEALASLAIGAMISIGMFEMGRKAVESLILGSQPEVSNTMLIVAVVTLGVNVVVTRVETREGKRLNSTLLLADAQHTLSDVFVSIAVIGSLILSRLHVPRADGVVALAVLVFVAYAAWGVIRRAVEPLSDAARLDPIQVRELCLAIDGVRDAREVRSRGMDDAVRVDLKIDVEPGETVAKAHLVANQVEAAIQQAFTQVAEVVVHIEPARSPR
ncbi:MAG: cation efflux family protein [Myxococcaceae bacterium]|nr:cation efflux family protein [Myxococcaceae bacterium]